MNLRIESRARGTERLSGDHTDVLDEMIGPILRDELVRLNVTGKVGVTRNLLLPPSVSKAPGVASRRS
jgi:hypothetical protein